MLMLGSRMEETLIVIFRFLWIIQFFIALAHEEIEVRPFCRMGLPCSFVIEKCGGTIS